MAAESVAQTGGAASGGPGGAPASGGAPGGVTAMDESTAAAIPTNAQDAGAPEVRRRRLREGRQGSTGPEQPSEQIPWWAVPSQRVRGREGGGPRDGLLGAEACHHTDRRVRREGEGLHLESRFGV